MSMVLANASSPLLLLGYIWSRRLHRQTWGGWSWESLRGWGQFARFAFPGLMMVVFEWCSIEISTFVAGSISQTQLGISSVIANLLNVIYMVRHCGGVGYGMCGITMAINCPLGDSEQVFSSLRFPLASALQCPFVLVMNWGQGSA